MPKILVAAGLDNRLPPESLSIPTDQKGVYSSLASVAVNVDFYTGHVSRCKGWSLADAGDYHSLFQSGSTVLGVKNGMLGYFVGTTFTPLVAVSSLRIAYADTGAGIYLSDGQSVHVFNDGVMTRLARSGSYLDGSLDPTEDAARYDSPPPGTVLTWMFGRLFVADDFGVYYSRGLRPDQFNLADDYLDLPGVTMIGPVADGFYLGTGSEVLFIAGTNPKTPNPTRRVCDAGAVRGTATVLSGRYFGDGKMTADVVVWESSQGKVLGGPGGQVSLLTEKHVAYPSSSEGAAFLREINGEIHHVSALASPSFEGSNMRTSDTAVAEVIRNGIII